MKKRSRFIFVVVVCVLFLFVVNNLRISHEISDLDGSKIEVVHDKIDNPQHEVSPSPKPVKVREIQNSSVLVEKDGFKKENETFFGIFSKDDGDVIGEVLTYPKFHKKKVFEDELRSSVNKSILNDCFYCSYPYYPKNFIQTSSIMSFADAFSAFNEEKVIIMTNYKSPASRFEVYVKLFFEEDSPEKEVELSCEKPHGDPHRRSIRFICPIPTEKRWILHHCSYLQMYHCGSHQKILTERILVRHCSNSKNIKKKKLAICSMIENRDRFLLEWIEWHRMIGVEKFYLYFHPGGFHYYDETFDLLNEYFKRGIIHLFVWNYTIPIYARANEHNEDQVAAQNDCLNRWGDFYEWMAMIDDDEFIVPVSEDNILGVLDKNKASSVGGVMMNSWFYENERKTNSHLSSEIYFKFKEKKRTYKKTIIQPRNVNYFAVHGITSGKNSKFLSEDDVYLAHYFFRKWHDYNPIVENSPNSGEWNENTPLVRLIPKLKERLSVAEKVCHYDSFGFEYHNKLKSK